MTKAKDEAGAKKPASQGRDMPRLNNGNVPSGPAARRIAVIVLGMHRSGTSAFARVLNLLGCDLPKTLMAADRSNEAGHWESFTIARLNDEILDSGGSNWHDWLAFNKGWYSSPKAAEFKEKALAALRDEFCSSRLLVLKDPRICRLVPFWVDVLKSAGLQPAIIMPIRNPLEVAASLANRNGIDPALGHLLWLRHVLEAESGSRGLPRIHTSYDALLTGWPQLVNRAQEALGITWPRFSAMTGEEIDAFLTSRLRHYQEASKSVSENPLLSAWLREAFAIFSRWAENGEATEDHACLDRIRTQLDAAAPAFSHLISAGRQSAKRADSLEASLKEVQGKLADAEAASATQETHVKTLERQLEETRTALSASTTSVEQKTKEIADAAGRLTEARSELEKRHAEAQSLRTELEQTRGEFSHIQSELAQRRAEADDATAELQKAEERAARLAGELDNERSRVSAELQKAEERAARLAGELDNERSRASAELQKLRREKGAAEERLAERFKELAIMTRLLGDKEGAAKASEHQAAWLRDVSAVLLNGSRSRSLKSQLAALLPGSIRLKKQKARLRKTGIFDPEAYLAANPDVAEAGADPLWHYINHGMAEGRQLHSIQAQGEHKSDHAKNR